MGRPERGYRGTTFKIKDMSYKSDFQKWKKVTLTNVFDNLSGISDRDLKVGDMVMYINGFGQKFGPFEILGFCIGAEKWGVYVFLDKENYWFPDNIDSVYLVSDYEKART